MEIDCANKVHEALSCKLGQVINYFSVTTKKPAVRKILNEIYHANTAAKEILLLPLLASYLGEDTKHLYRCFDVSMQIYD